MSQLRIRVLAGCAAGAAGVGLFAGSASYVAIGEFRPAGQNRNQRPLLAL